MTAHYTDKHLQKALSFTNIYDTLVLVFTNLVYTEESMSQQLSTISKTTIFTIAIFLILLSPLPVSGSTRPAVGAAITVNIATDEYDLSGSGTGCSLREAIRAADTNAAFGGCTAGVDGADTILLSTATYTLTLHGTGAPTQPDREFGDLDPESAIVIQGAGMMATVVDATGADDRIFECLSYGTDLTLNDMTLTGGQSKSYGGAIFANSKPLTVSRVSFLNNHAADGTDGTIGSIGDPGSGGGAIYIFNNTLSVTDSYFEGNLAGSGGDGGYGLDATTPGASGGSGGGGMTAGYGGAIYNYGGTMTVTDSIFVENYAGEGGSGGHGGAGAAGSVGSAGGNGGSGGLGGHGGMGGAIYSDGTATIINSEFYSNAAGASGDGGYGGPGGDGGAGAADSAGGNGGKGGNGGGVLTQNQGGAIASYNGSMTITRSTFLGNTSGNGGDGGSAGNAGNGGAGGFGSTTTGGAGGAGGLAAIAGSGGPGGDGGAVYINNSSTQINNNTFSANMTGRGGDGGAGGDAGSGGNGGNSSLYAGGAGGAGAYASAGGGGGQGGNGAAISVAPNTAVTFINLTISGNETGVNGYGSEGGIGGNGGNGGSGTTQGAGGNAGNGGSGGYGGGTGNGGGIYLAINAPLNLRFNTIYQNATGLVTASPGAPGAGGSGGTGSPNGSNGVAGSTGSAGVRGNGGGLWKNTGAISLGGMILDDNDARYGSDCYGASGYSSLGWNIITDISNCTIAAGEDDYFNAPVSSILLGPLQVNITGPMTHALLSTSIGFDAVDGGEAGCADEVLTDARGFSRPFNNYCDAGAYEYHGDYFDYLPLLNK
jgi:CSLREA domain-containing protein